MNDDHLAPLKMANPDGHVITDTHVAVTVTVMGAMLDSDARTTEAWDAQAKIAAAAILEKTDSKLDGASPKT